MPATIAFLLAGIFLTIFLVIGIHEFGHFLAARLLGIRVLKFSLGFGRKLVSVSDRKKTEYVIAAIPLGGYVSLLEEEDASDADRHQVFSRQSLWKRFIVIIAGPSINLFFALLIYWIIFMKGFMSLLPVTGNITPHSIAAIAGVTSHQQITRIDDIPVASWTAVMIRILIHAGNHDQLTIETQTLNKHHLRKHTLNLANWQLDALKPDLLKSLGLSPWFPKSHKLQKKLLHHNQYGPIDAMAHAWQNTHDFTWLNLVMAGRMLSGKLSLKSLGGPISIFGEAGDALHNGLTSFMSFIAFLSIAIGIINFFPIPGLDGGHLFFQIIETIIRRPIPIRIMNLFYRMGILLIIFISVQAVVNDFMRLKS